MALTLNLTATSSNLAAFLTNYSNPSNFTYNDNGWFNDSITGVDQFVAGIDTEGTPNGKSSVIMNGTNYNYESPGQFTGTVETLELGSNLTYVPTSDLWVQDEGLRIDFNGAPQTATFAQAIFTLSHGGLLEGGFFFGQQFAGLYDYFEEQGTIQIGTELNDVFLGFGGIDTFEFTATSNGADQILGFATNQDVVDLEAITAITDFDDLVENHLSADGAGNAVISWDTGESVTLVGHAFSTFASTFDAGDFHFA